MDTNSVFQLQTRLTTAGIAGIVFDYYGAKDFKFAGINVATKQVIIGHVGSKGLVIDAALSRPSLSATGTYLLDVSLKGTTVSVSLDGNQVLGFVFNAPVVDGEAGVFARNGTASSDTYLHRTNDLQFLTQLEGSFLSAAYAPLTENAAAALTTSELQRVVEAVISWFAVHGSTAEEIALLRATPVLITQPSGLHLGWTDGSGVQIDTNAAGHSWSTSTSGNIAAERMDLMSVLAHEFAHVLGREHPGVVGSPVVFMNDLLLPGTRLLPDLVVFAQAPETVGNSDPAAGLRYAAERVFSPIVLSPLPSFGLSSLGAQLLSMPEFSLDLSLTKASGLRAFGKKL